MIMIGDRVTAITRTHATTDQVMEDIRQLSEADFSPGGRTELRDESALSIASWWQSPGRTGRAFAELASTGSVRVSELLEDIFAARQHADSDSALALDLLATWALNHPSR